MQFAGLQEIGLWAYSVNRAEELTKDIINDVKRQYDLFRNVLYALLIIALAQLLLFLALRYWKMSANLIGLLDSKTFLTSLTINFLALLLFFVFTGLVFKTVTSFTVAFPLKTSISSELFKTVEEALLNELKFVVDGRVISQVARGSCREENCVFILAEFYERPRFTLRAWLILKENLLLFMGSVTTCCAEIMLTEVLGWINLIKAKISKRSYVEVTTWLVMRENLYLNLRNAIYKMLEQLKVGGGELLVG
ncbi:MAG: hypothetical protein DRJ38_09530 [Thermoprotei archaeon]|nr:MAG: hypothetical protein DRJ38_09530 [Thermoprotei archaeon]